MSLSTSVQKIYPRKSSGSMSKLNTQRYSEDSEEIKHVGSQLMSIVKIMETNPRKTINHLKEFLAKYKEKEYAQRWVTFWVDHRGLDLLQNAIINSSLKIIQYLLNDTDLFPASHQPKSNPYAHLAAMIGNTECLAALLTARPEYYFAASVPNHAVRLPVDVLKKLKLGTTSSKAMDRLLSVIKRDTEIAERGIRIRIPEIIPEDEIKVFQASLKPASSKTKRCQFEWPRLVPKLSSVKQSVSSKQLMPSKVTTTWVKRYDKPVNKVTVYWDVFRDKSLDRVTEGGNVQNEKEHKRAKMVSVNENRDKRMHSGRRDSHHHTDRRGTSYHSDYRSSHYHRDKSSVKEQQIRASSNPIELGVRRIRKYKEFHPVFRHHTIIDDPKRYMGKTPLTYAAEKKHYGSVNYLLNKFHYNGFERHGKRDNSLVLASNARSPEAIAAVLDQNITQLEYQSAVLLSLRELFSDTLSALLNLGSKYRAANLFDGVNLYHMLYSQSMQTISRINMLPEMTRILILSKEDVNTKTPPRTFPIYTLIRCAFNQFAEGKSLAYVESLKLLLQARANPNFDEKKIVDKQPDMRTDLNLARPLYRSAVHCIFINAKLSIHNFEHLYWPQIIMQKLLETLEAYDKTTRRINNEILFYYMSSVSELGVNRRILRMLLRYGANPDYTVEGKYAIDTFFENMLPFMTKYQIDRRTFLYGDLLESLVVLCKAMSQSCLRAAVVQFLDNHFMSVPLQALELARNFCYHANKMITCPRSLAHLATHTLWVYYKRNSKTIRDLPITQDLKNQILP